MVAAEWLEADLGPRLGGPGALREAHFVEALNAGVQESLGDYTAVGKVISIRGWPSLGRSGVALALASERGRYELMLEAKWCHSGTDKIYEAIWDLFKMALALRRPDTVQTYLVTGAPRAMWLHAFCGDLFMGGHFDPGELCRRTLPWGA